LLIVTKFSLFLKQIIKIEKSKIEKKIEKLPKALKIENFGALRQNDNFLFPSNILAIFE